MNELTAVFADVGLAAACGFRIFVPLFVAGVATNKGVDAVGGVNFQKMLNAKLERFDNAPDCIATSSAAVVAGGTPQVLFKMAQCLSAGLQLRRWAASATRPFLIAERSESVRGKL